MKKIITALFCVTFLIGSTWQGITSDTPTKTQLKLIYSDIETSKIEFLIDGFHLTPVKTPAGDMYLVKLDDGASLLLEGAPDIHKYARSIIDGGIQIIITGMLIYTSFNKLEFI